LKKLLFGVLVVILLLAAVGCGKSATTMTATTTTRASYDQYNRPAATTVITIPPPVAETSGGFFGLGKGDETGSAPPVVTVNHGPVVTSTPMPTSTGSSYYDVNIPAERMVIKTGNIALVVEDVTTAIQQITALATANGGYVINSDLREDQSRLYANISFRVEAGKFEQTLHSLHGLAVDVRSESTSGEDVTQEYVDLDAKLRNLEASESQLLELMKKAGTVEEILKVQQTLTDTRGQIEQIKGRMQYLSQSSSLSIIYASLEQSKLTVEFMASSSTVKEGKDIQFYPTISGGFEPYSFEWNFGDGETSTDGAPAHAYGKHGTYTVTLTIKDDKGGTASTERKDYITVLTGWDAGNVASSAWHGLVGFGRFLGSLFIWLGILSPIWIGILVILYFAVWRRRKKKS
jgi:PKD repeat protein